MERVYNVEISWRLHTQHAAMSSDYCP